MADVHEDDRAQADAPLGSRSVSRREFLKIAGIAGATIGVGAGLGGLAAACGGGEETTTTAGGVTTTAGGVTTTTAAASTTTVSAGAETGREVKVGWVTMTTGAFAGLSEPDDFLLKQAKDAVGDGLMIAGKKHPITWIVKDSQSDPNRSGEVAGELITGDKPDIIFAGMTPVVCSPVSDQCEANGMPLVAYGVPMEPWFFGRGGDPAVGFKWVYDMFWSIADLQAVYYGMWDKIPTNKTVACFWANDPDGVATSDPKTGFPPEMEKRGYKVVNPGLYNIGTEDFSSLINKYKAAGCELLAVLATPPDFANFWKQANQQGFKPKIATVARAILVRPDMEAIGDIGAGLCTEVWWEASHPFVSSLTGFTCRQQADAWEAEKNSGYNASLGLTGGAFEVVVDVLKRTKNIDDPASVAEAIKATDLKTILGPIKFGTQIPNVAPTPLVGGQWEKGTKWTWDRFVVDNSHNPECPTTGTLHPLA